MHIRQIPKSSVNTERTWGKWYCGDANEEGTVHRYLHPDGSWKNYAHYFDNEAQIQEALKIGISPDFTESVMERDFRLMMEADMERDLDRFNDFDDTPEGHDELFYGDD